VDSGVGVNFALGGRLALLRNSCARTGGTDLRLAAVPGGAALRWRPGLDQAGYFVLRLAGGRATLLPSLPTPLPPSAAGYVDTGVTPGVFTCYLVLPVHAGGVLGRSDQLCLVPDSHAGAVVPPGFAVQLGQSPTATLTWGLRAPLAPETLLAVPLNGAPPRRRELSGTSFARDDTGGVATCYLLVARSTTNVPLGRTDTLCAVPGVATLGPAGSGTAAAVRAAAEVGLAQMRSLEPWRPRGAVTTAR
jgi:hypothetical protein